MSEKGRKNLSKQAKPRKTTLEYHPQRNQKIKLVKSLAILLDAETSNQPLNDLEAYNDEESSSVRSSLLTEAKRG
jgi:hypothetical protein